MAQTAPPAVTVIVGNPQPSVAGALLIAAAILFTVICATAAAVWVSWNIIDWLDSRRARR